MVDRKAEAEWFAWLLLGKLLKARGIEMNDPAHEELVRVIRHWGELHRQLYEGTGERSCWAEADARTVAGLLQKIRVP